MAKPTPKKSSLGLTLPIKNSGENGYFDQTTDTFSQIRTNIINLIRTKPGERRMQPLFGCRLWEVLFDQQDEFLPDKIKTIIKEDVSGWIPGITISDITLSENEENPTNTNMYTLYISITFVIDSIQKEDVANITININKI